MGFRSGGGGYFLIQRAGLGMFRPSRFTLYLYLFIYLFTPFFIIIFFIYFFITVKVADKKKKMEKGKI